MTEDDRQSLSAKLLTEIPALAPDDAHNRELAHNVHPPEWKNPEPPSEPYQLVVIGAGTAGLVTAAGAAGLGARVALIERHLMGGDCLNVGCVPSKALIRSARAAADVREAGKFGVQVPAGTRVDFGAVMERMRSLRAGISKHDSARRFTELGVDVYVGEGRFTSARSIEVGGATLRFSRAVIATGARAAAPPIPGLAEAGYLTNETVFSLTELPKRLAVIGAGPIGCELAQSFARFGSEVHLIERGKHILGREDPDAAALVQAAIDTDGVICHFEASLKGVRAEAGEKRLSIERDGQQEEVVVDEILVGVGRAPNLDLGLDAAGVRFDERKGVEVDDYLRTSNPRVFAAGDVCSKYKFTHTADATARIVIQNALFSIGPFGRARQDGLVVPWTTYTDPEVAHVGMYEHDAREAGIETDTIRVDLGDLDRAILDGEREGLLKVHVKKGSDRILGATLVSRHAGETISEVTLAMVAGAGLKTLASTIHPYPTQAEILKRAGDAFNKTRLTDGAKRVLGLLMKLKR